MLRINITKGEKFAKKVLNAYKNGLLGSLDNPNVWKFSPPSKAKTKEDKFRYLFYILCVDYGMRAAKLFERAKVFYDKNKDLFNPFYLKNFSVQTLENILRKNLRLRFPKQGAIRWIENSKRIIKFSNGSFSDFFKRNLTAEEFVLEIKKFYGFGEKLARLLLRVLVDLNLIKKPKGYDLIPMPIDIHDVKLAFRSGLLSGETPNYSKHSKIAREAWTKACLKARLSPMDVDKALWALGANFCYFKKCLNCPMSDLCNKKFLN